MQLLFLDESGTHAGSPNLVIGGVSLHESHLGEATRRLDDLMASALSSRGLVAADYEFHAAEMKSPKPQKRGKKASLWLAIAENDRMALLADAYDVVGSLQCTQGWHVAASSPQLWTPDFTPESQSIYVSSWPTRRCSTSLMTPLIRIVEQASAWSSMASASSRRTTSRRGRGSGRNPPDGFADSRSWRWCRSSPIHAAADCCRWLTSSRGDSTGTTPPG